MKGKKSTFRFYALCLAAALLFANVNDGLHTLLHAHHLEDFHCHSTSESHFHDNSTDFDCELCHLAGLHYFTKAGNNASVIGPGLSGRFVDSVVNYFCEEHYNCPLSRGPPLV